MKKNKSFVGMTADERRALFRKCVEEAGLLVKQRWTWEVRLKIVGLALQCCDRFRGGRAVNNIWTLQSFCDAIGLKSHTLCEWMRIKELCLDKLPQAKRDNYLTTYVEMITGLKRDTPAAEVERRYDAFISQSNSQFRFNKYFKSLKSIHFNAIRPENLTGVDKATLETTALLCGEIKKSVQKYLRK